MGTDIKYSWFSLKGKIGRKQFVIRNLALFVLMVLLGVLFSINSSTPQLITTIFFMPFFYALWAQQVKRLRDMGLKGRFAFIPVACMLLSVPGEIIKVGGVYVFNILFAIILFLYLLFLIFCKKFNKEKVKSFK